MSLMSEKHTFKLFHPAYGWVRELNSAREMIWWDDHNNAQVFTSIEKEEWMLLQINFPELQIVANLGEFWKINIDEDGLYYSKDYEWAMEFFEGSE